ncbi:HEPN domain-containing protein [Iningainema tapete]|uniref:HEPN domain-containing protein n=1 Tax=Iningainema tapete BLCC-T55 TaxID=2748662 RepID=A0A8J7CBT8_9CYAN|nr:HEPN domain-containing protein [Iningainema tapete]MBD2778711.1 HEPN domain-containing protein [Iningainema tapete BLCC-T55]
MKFDWYSYLALAEHLLNEVNTSFVQSNNPSDCVDSNSINEAKLRCASSRAYYSAFCLARSYLRDVAGYYQLEEWQEYKTRPHEFIISTFRDNKNRDYNRIGVFLERLRKIRNQADYQDSVSFQVLSSEAKYAVNIAKQIIEHLRKLEQK